MSVRFRSTLLVILAVSAAFVGGWAVVAPRSFYASFPGAGRHWVAVDGPYNEHLLRDVGGLYLALLVLTVWAVRHPTLGRIAGTSWLVFSVPHLIYHASHLGMFSTVDEVGNIVTLGGTVVLAAMLVAPCRVDVTPGAATSSVLDRDSWTRESEH